MNVHAAQHTHSRRSEATRRLILDTALALFREHGFDATTMREIATAAGVAVGGAYYYFRSKEEMILAFYEQTQEESEISVRQAMAEHHDPMTRLRIVFLQKIDQLTPHRQLALILVRHALDIDSPLSPFSPATAGVRDQAVAIIAHSLAETKICAAPEIRPLLPTIFWLLQMLILLFWIFDNSPEQQRTRRLVDDILSLSFLMLRLSRLPFTGRFWRPLLGLLQEIQILPTRPLTTGQPMGGKS